MKFFLLGLFSILISIFQFLFGRADYLFLVTIALFGINFILILCYDLKMKQFKWSNIFSRFISFTAYLSIITISVFLDQLLETTIIRKIVLFTLLADEMLSILNICNKLGLKIPEILKQKIQKLGEKEIDSVSTTKEESKEL